jgi:hypothetical protein
MTRLSPEKCRSLPARDAGRRAFRISRSIRGLSRSISSKLQRRRRGVGRGLGGVDPDGVHPRVVDERRDAEVEVGLRAGDGFLASSRLGCMIPFTDGRKARPAKAGQMNLGGASRSSRGWPLSLWRRASRRRGILCWLPSSRRAGGSRIRHRGRHRYGRR